MNQPKKGQNCIKFGLRDSHQLNEIYMKEYRVIQRMFFQFKLAYQHKALGISQFQGYIKIISQLSIALNQYLRNSFNLLQKKQFDDVLRNTQFLISDKNQKFKRIVRLCQQNQERSYQIKKPPRQLTTCQRCSEDIRKVRIQKVKEHLQNQYMGTLDRIILQAKMEINGQLFTQEQDRLFFKQLHDTLRRKHENIEFNDKSIQDLINKVTTQIYGMELFKKIVIRESKQLQSPNYTWHKNIQTSLNQLLQSSFKKKIPVFLQSMMGYFQAHFNRVHYKQMSQKSFQTFDYQSFQISQLKQKLMKSNSLNFKLQNDTKWLQEQIQVKNIQLSRQLKTFKNQRQYLFNEVISHKQKNMVLQFAISNLNQQIVVTKDQISKVNQKQNWFKKKIIRVQKQNKQLQIQNIRNPAEKQILNIKNKEGILQDDNFQMNDSQFTSKKSLKSKIKSRKLIPKLNIKQIKPRARTNASQKILQFQSMKNISSLNEIIFKNNNQVDQMNTQLYQNTEQKIFSVVEQQQNTSGQSEQQSKSQIRSNNETRDNNQLLQNQELSYKDGLNKLGENQKNNQIDQTGYSQNQEINKPNQNKTGIINQHNKYLDFPVNQQITTNNPKNADDIKVKRINQLMQQKLKQTGLLIKKRNHNKSQLLYRTYGKLHTQHNQNKTQDQIMEGKCIPGSQKNYHFLSQTFLNSCKSKNLQTCQIRSSNFPSQKIQFKSEIQNELFPLILEKQCKMVISQNNNRKTTTEQERTKHLNQSIVQSKVSKDIQCLILRLKRKLSGQKQNNRQSNKDLDMQLKLIVSKFLFEHGIKCESDHSHVLKNKKTNMHVKFFKESDLNVVTYGNQMNSKIYSQLKVQKSFVQKKFPVIYNSCFNSSNRKVVNNLKTETNRFQNSHKKKEIRNSLPADSQLQDYESEQKGSRQQQNPAYCPEIMNRDDHKKGVSISLNKKTHGNQPHCQQIFTKHDFELFLTQSKAYSYECNHMKTHHKAVQPQLTQQQSQTVSNIFADIQTLRSTNKFFYQQIISFIRYPYQTVKNSNWGACIIRGMKFESFIKFMERIVHLHRKCKHNKNGLCQHLVRFQKKVHAVKKQAEQMVMAVSKGKNLLYN